MRLDEASGRTHFEGAGVVSGRCSICQRGERALLKLPDRRDDTLDGLVSVRVVGLFLTNGGLAHVTAANFGIVRQSVELGLN